MFEKFKILQLEISLISVMKYALKLFVTTNQMTLGSKEAWDDSVVRGLQSPILTKVPGINPSIGVHN